MINALHLLWIIPLSASFGCFIMAMFQINRDERDEQKRGEIMAILRVKDAEGKMGE